MKTELRTITNGNGKTMERHMNIVTTILGLVEPASKLVAEKEALFEEAEALCRRAQEAATAASNRSLPGNPLGAIPVDTRELAAGVAALRQRAKELGVQLVTFRESIPEEIKVPIEAVWRSHAPAMTSTQWAGWLGEGWTPDWGTPKTSFDEVAADYVYGANFPVKYSGNASRGRGTAALFGRGPRAAGTVAPPKYGELADALVVLANARWHGVPSDITSAERLVRFVNGLNHTAYKNRRRIRRRLRKQGVLPVD